MKSRKRIIILVGCIIILIIACVSIALIQNNKNKLAPNNDLPTESKKTIDSHSKETTSNKNTLTTIKEESTNKIEMTDPTTALINTTTNKKSDNNSKITTEVFKTTTNKTTKAKDKTTTTKRSITASTKKTTTKTIITTKKTTTTNTVVDEVDSLRKKLESTYHITIKYGHELGNYRPKGLTPTKMTDKEEIKKHLKLIENELKKYPTGFFKEFDGMPLTIYLVTSVPGNAFAGFTDKEFMNNIKITLTDNFLFEYTFNHEIMHYIDAYLEIKMYPRNPYDEYMNLNPQGYQYGKPIQSYNYGYNQQVRGAYFLNDYSQSNVREDRAEVFKQMITRLYKPVGMFNNGETLQRKALVIDQQIRDNFKTAKGTLYWDKIVK